MAPANKFCFPIPAVLESERVKLVPFDFAVHTKLLITACSDVSSYDFIPMGPFKDEEEFMATFQNEKAEDKGTIMFAVYDRTKEEGYAGRTHVTSNAIGILLKHSLDLPEDGGLGLRRVVWQASAANVASIRTAKRMGFKQEGVLRWHKAWPESKSRGANGIRVRKGDPGKEVFPLGRDTVVLSICWDDWEGGVRAHVEATMARTE
ncbi:uncharacterized protein EV420DRAFT_1472977 [Desarmillaria tabescens]|uniref:N-acetyltransferase domain-containing protein n=1 Tax=Armillaria tabescens TaxID=1929756 RepID=A0AA39NQ88_ARMTA|nr:uncharacterized protein EV420DRAFT_1472977 [Desarmillaria tabescens]KAK0469818.1 hypothetical protein EV420DRAFT_1472977 [Desarmillaria tabescens]